MWGVNRTEEKETVWGCEESNAWKWELVIKYLKINTK
jgi:hypothetical protein